MAFTLDDIVIDRIQYGVAENSKGDLLYTLTQLQNATINITAESKDATDSTGTLIKRFYQGKSGEFSAENALLNLNVLGEASGEGKITADEQNAIQMPRIITVKSGSTVTLTNYVTGTVKVNALGNNGSMGKAYTQSTSASETEFGLTTAGVLTPPTDGDATQYIVKYERKVTSGIAIKNKADVFPSTSKLTLKALCIDPCEADVLRACYIVLPSFQVSPEVEITLDTESSQNFSGALQVDRQIQQILAIYLLKIGRYVQKCA